MTSYPSTSRQPARWRAKTAVVLLIAAASSLAAVGPLAATALAASPQVTIMCSAANNCWANGTGFTPRGEVLEQASTARGVFSSVDLTASAPTVVCSGGVKPHCIIVGGGTFSVPLPLDYGLACDASAAGTVSYTDETSHAVVTKQVTYVGPCPQPTTTALSIPSTIDTSWTSPANPASVTSGSTLVTSGTVTITVNGATFCTYAPGASNGCTLANLPAGTDIVRATYSGSNEPRYDPSSASATVTVLPVFTFVPQTGPNWAGYAANGDKFTAASASWVVPKANCGNLFQGGSQAEADSATWVGIDGFNESTGPEQIGTDTDCGMFAPPYTGEYHAWWQMAPALPHTIGIPNVSNRVYPGDVMVGSVTSTGVPGQYTLSLTDQTQNWTYSTTQTNPAATGGTAECIEEQPSFLSFPLTNFGSVTFSQCRFTGSDGVATPVWDHPNFALTMANGKTTQASVFPLSDDGTQFTVNFVHG